jgi:hypothetical protein
MDSLVKSLLSFTDNPIKIPSPKTISSAKQAASFLLNLYALPPGPISTIQ